MRNPQATSRHPTSWHRRSIPYLAIFVGSLSYAAHLHAQDVDLAKKVGELEFSGEILGEEDISGIALRDEFLVLVTDEGQSIQVLKKRGEDSFKASSTRVQRLIDWPEEKELDLEGVAWGERFVYAIGSHSQKRRTVSAVKRETKKNRDRLFETAIEPSREYLFRFEIEDGGKIDESSIQHVSLRDEFANHQILRRFQVIPSKENGIDIEGVAIGDEDRIYIGFRGPVLRGGYVPILIARIKEDDEGRLEAKVKGKEGLRFVNLGGRGVRDITRLPSAGDDPRFLILAGPMGDGPASYVVYEWNGKDTVPGTDDLDAHDHADALCEIPLAENPEGGAAKAEGISVRKLSDDSVEFIIVYDSAINGAPTLFSCPRT